MRIGILGAGVSGMTAAWLLQHDHQVTLFEKGSRIGGHVESVPVTLGPETVHGELGTRFFFDSAYPYFLSLLRLLEVPTRWTNLTVCVTEVARAKSFALPPRSPRQVVGLARSPRFVRHLLSLRRMIEQQRGNALLRNSRLTLREHLAQGGYPAAFGPEFAYPFLAACWGAPLTLIPDFPLYSLLKGMPPGRRPGTYEVEGGMSNYLAALRKDLTRVDLRLGLEARSVERRDGLVVVDASGEQHRFDQLIVATTSREAAELLRGVPELAPMQAAVGAFQHWETETVVHGDPAFMPPDRRDWAHNNLFFDGDQAWMTDWQGLRTGQPVFRTWMPKGRPAPSPLYGRRSYHHVLMSAATTQQQAELAAHQGAHGLWVTGMYCVDVDNHESALLSALVPARALAPNAPNLRRLLEGVAANAVHSLDILPQRQPASEPAARPNQSANA